MLEIDSFIGVMKKLGIPIAYDHFSDGSSPEPPFLVLRVARSNNFMADNSVYKKINVIDLELYTDKKDISLEGKVEKMLDDMELCYEKSEIYIDSEHMYEVLYEMEVL